MGKFYYITYSQYKGIENLFRTRDPEQKLVLHRSKGFCDVATYSPKYDTVVFTTVKAETVQLPANDDDVPF